MDLIKFHDLFALAAMIFFAVGAVEAAYAKGQTRIAVVNGIAAIVCAALFVWLSFRPPRPH